MREFAYAEPTRAEPPQRPRIGVALGGGFARGIAHLGVLRVLEQENIPVDYLGGTSAGAMLAIAYASGHTIHEIVAQARATRFKDFGNWKLSWLGLASNQRLEHYPRKYLGVSTFEDLRIPLAIAATDLGTGEPVYFTRGPLDPRFAPPARIPGCLCRWNSKAACSWMDFWPRPFRWTRCATWARTRDRRVSGGRQ